MPVHRNRHHHQPWQQQPRRAPREPRQAIGEHLHRQRRHTRGEAEAEFGREAEFHLWREQNPTDQARDEQA